MLPPLIKHHLPAAPVFIGRVGQLRALEDFWRSGSQRVASLMAIGGAGKTAIAKRFLDFLMQSPEASPKPGAVFVWSFYVDQDTSKFLQELYGYFTGRTAAGSADIALLHSLDAALRQVPHSLLILDGLERVQRELHERKNGHSGLRHVFGELEDPLMKQFLTRLVHGPGNAKCVITTRFPVTDIAAWAGGEEDRYLPIHLDHLEAEDARQLLRRRGVTGDPPALDRLLESFGTHALTIDRLATYLVNFHGGDPGWAELFPEPQPLAASAEERKLARVLHAYETKLDERETALLSRICIFRFGITLEALHRMLNQPGASEEVSGALKDFSRIDLDRLAQRLIDINLIQREADGALTAHAAIRDHFYKLVTGSDSLHRAASKLFSRQLGVDAQQVIEQLEAAWRELLAEVRPPRSYRETEQTEDSALLEQRFHGACVQMASLIAEKLESPSTLDPTLRRELEHSYKRLMRVVSGEDDRGFDGYESLLSLTHKPGAKRAPSDKRTLDLLEELLYHTLQAGDREGALHIYDNHIGGRGHLADRLGQYNRGLRILRYFHPCPRLLDLGWYLRGCGELHAALEMMDEARPLWSGTILCLLGYLTRVREPHWSQSREIAAFLMDMLKKPLPIRARKDVAFTSYLGWGEAIVDADYALAAGTIEDARAIAVAGANQFGGQYLTHMPEAIRSYLALARVESRASRFGEAEAALRQAEAWILHSGSVEHTIILHLTRATIAADQGSLEQSVAAAEQGMQLARACSFSILHIDLALHLAMVHQRLGDEVRKAECLRLASHGVCRSSQKGPAEADHPLADMQVVGYLHPVCLYRRARRVARGM